ncbi:MAG: hypothetical protein PHF67_02830 [Candidatus Nanoarchaeia archaeon]|nr:hypothetical protein [Candidatus Nanoarchaeia archaeon]
MLKGTKNKDNRFIHFRNENDSKSIHYMNGKKAVSEIISYVILVAIVLFLATGVYIWLKTASNATPVADCKTDTSVVVSSYECLGDIKLSIKNNGYFNVDGIILSVGNDSQREPDTYLLSSYLTDSLAGHYDFIPSLTPGETREAKFITKTDEGNLKFNVSVIKIQPFIIDKNEEIICQNSVIKQNLDNCNPV